jgi:hypothetical protein
MVVTLGFSCTIRWLISLKKIYNSINGQQNSNVRRNSKFEGKYPKQLWYLF